MVFVVIAHDRAAAQRENHADGDDEQHQPASDGDRFRRNAEGAQHRWPGKEKEQHDDERDDELAQDDATAAVLGDALQHDEKYRHVAERVHDEKEGDGGRPEGFHGGSLRNEKAAAGSLVGSVRRQASFIAIHIKFQTRRVAENNTIAHRRVTICFLSMVRQGAPYNPSNETPYEVVGGLL